MDKWLYPTETFEAKKSYGVKKFGKTCFFPKSLVLEMEDYDYKYEHPNGGYIMEVRTKFKMPKWLVEKYKIEHWDNGTPKVGKIDDEVYYWVDFRARKYEGGYSIFHAGNRVIGGYGLLSFEEVAELPGNGKIYRTFNELIKAMNDNHKDFKLEVNEEITSL